jgi:hypothetical protein
MPLDLGRESRLVLHALHQCHQLKNNDVFKLVKEWQGNKSLQHTDLIKVM